MSTPLSDSLQLAVVSDSGGLSKGASARQALQQNAWDICSVLLSMRRDTSVIELANLASRLTKSRISPEFVEFLCRISESPVSITRYNSVSLSFRSLSEVDTDASDTGFAAQCLIPKLVEFFGWNLRMRKRALYRSKTEYADDEREGIMPSPKRIRTIKDKSRYNPPSSSDSDVLNGLTLSLPAESRLNSTELVVKLKGVLPDVNYRNFFLSSKDVSQITTWEEDLPSSFCSRIQHEEVDYTKQDSEIPSMNDCFKDHYVSQYMQFAVKEKTMKFLDSVSSIRDQGEMLELLPQSNAAILPMAQESDSGSIKNINAAHDIPSFCNNFQNDFIVDSASNIGFRSRISSVDLVKINGDATIRESDILGSLNSKDVPCLREREKNSEAQMEINPVQNSGLRRNGMPCRESNGHAASSPHHDRKKRNLLPDFEAYSVLEIEGSGGYGTVYRAQRKSDGTTVAIKCPHADAHKTHVNNELRMLERFGGKNFIIKYEGFLKSGDSTCFVLEHVEHDRPEVLKKEINISELQWYGYCMFRALAGLHKQGIFHRDVKPGNFLFSRNTNKGYLIDFNLAMDVNQKYRSRHSRASPPNSQSGLSINRKKNPMARSSIPAASQINKCFKSGLYSNSVKKGPAKARTNNDLRRWNQYNSQGADGSGVTSAKDATSTRTPSGERRREPLPLKGRKELINLVQENMAGPNREVSRVPTITRKRVAASPSKVEKTRIFFTPMPVKSDGLSLAGGELKCKKEGSCAGTKGFRAPEVCLRSPHQGPKTDVWSAGVTMLYLMIGKAPFTGEPEKNLKEMTKLRGSEDLWEVAKLHNRESSFPEELYDLQYLPSMSLREWCLVNTRRRDFFDDIPQSLFDLLDKCLTVNPRLRISAVEALKHEFFAPIVQGLKKQKTLRREHNSSGN